MTTARRPLVVLLCLAALCGAAAAYAQPPAAPEAPGFDPGQVQRELMMQLLQTWVEMARGVVADAGFMEQPQAQALMRRAEVLNMINDQFRRAMRPWGPDTGPQDNGRFQFVEWLDPGVTYRVLDTRTGALERREAPPPEQ
jgi:hypothetical protein